MSNIKIHPNIKAGLYGLHEDECKHVKAMNIEELRASEHFQDWTEDELISMIDTVRTFTEIVYNAWSKSKQNSQKETLLIPIDNQHCKAA